MRFIWTFGAACLLAGCAESNFGSDLTPEQRANLAAAILSRPQPQPYILPVPVQPIQQSVPRTCTSSVNGQIINTTCY